MKERKRKKLSRIETQLDYSSADDTQEETLNQTSADDTATKLSQLEELYEEKKKVKNTVLLQFNIFLYFLYIDTALFNAVRNTTYIQVHSP